MHFDWGVVSFGLFFGSNRLFVNLKKYDLKRLFFSKKYSIDALHEN